MHADHNGALVISLDFELHWGVRDHRSVAEYSENLLGARRAIPQVLELFERYQIHATWATVGMLFFANKQELLAGLPAEQPHYNDPQFSAYQELDLIGDDEQSDPYHYAASLVRQLCAAPGQEVATHTFSHFFCLEAGAAPKDLEADLRAAAGAANRYGVELKSIVFPRNQVDASYLATLEECGLVAYRGNQRSSLYAAGDTRRNQNLFVRLARLADAYLPLTSLSARSIAEIAAAGRPYDVPASRFLRPYSPLLAPLEALRLHRIKREMTRAAKERRVYHLWWHPHNFGKNTAENLASLEELLRHFSRLRREHGMESLSMKEIAQVADRLAQPAGQASPAHQPVP